MDVFQYRHYIVKPTLLDFSLWSKEAEDLVVGTALHESGGLRYVHQVGGPAKGFVQMEPATYRDLHTNFIAYRDQLRIKLWDRFDSDMGHSPDRLVTDLALGVIMCRIHYLRSPGNIPTDLRGQAEYWKKYYNTSLGKGTVQQYIDHYNKWNKE